MNSSSFSKRKKTTASQPVVFLRYTIILLVVFSFVFLSVFWMMVGNRETHLIENFENRDLVETLKWLQDHDLHSVIYEKLDAEVDRYRIISQSPEPGIGVKVGRTVTLVVSIGTKLEIMEDFIGKDFVEAKNQIYTQLAGETRIPRVVKIDRFSSEYEEGLIIKQAPRPQEYIDQERDIVFFVSKGIVKEVLAVDDYRFLPYEKIYRNLTLQGIDVQGEFLISSDGSNVGLIFEQNVPPGSKLIEGDVIRFVVGVRADERVEAVDKRNIEKLRILTIRIPFPSSSATGSVDNGIDDLRANSLGARGTGFYCPCLDESALYKGESAQNPETAVADESEGSRTPSELTILRKVELVVNDLTLRERKVVYDHILAGRVVTLPYHTVGSGSLTIYLDGELYRQENFYD